jgi:hypothetical protein
MKKVLDMGSEKDRLSKKQADSKSEQSCSQDRI